MKNCILKILFCLSLFTITACTTTTPRDANNICSMFREYPTWYWDTQAAQKQWGIPIYVLMSIIYQESHFKAGAQPPRQKILWIIPWFRPTSSFGYAQAVNNTWRKYQQETGHRGANRDTFGDAADFIGWYSDQIHKRLGISKWDAKNLYLAYHEGMGGYSRGTYRSKQWLINVARNVQRRAWLYRSQLRQCQSSLPQKPWWHFW